MIWDEVEAGSKIEALGTFEVQMGMIDRGAELKWLSQCTHHLLVALHLPTTSGPEPSQKLV